MEKNINIDPYNINDAQFFLGGFPKAYKISQKTGNLIDPISEEEKKYIDFIWTGLSFSKIHFSGYRPGVKTKLLCKASGINKKGSLLYPDSGEDMQAGPCNTCPLNKWVNGNSPVCMDVYNILGFELPKKEPFTFLIKGKGIKSLRILVSSLRFSLKVLSQGVHPFVSHVISLSAKPVQIGNQEFFIPSFQIKEPFSQEEASLYYKVACTLAASSSILALPEPVDEEKKEEEEKKNEELQLQNQEIFANERRINYNTIINDDEVPF